MKFREKKNLAITLSWQKNHVTDDFLNPECVP